MSDIIKNHKASFLPKSNAFSSVSSKLLIPSTSMVAKASKVRLKPRKEVYNSKTQLKTTGHVNAKRQLSCSFCGSHEKGEQISNCKARSCLRLKLTEYLLGPKENGLTNLIRRYEHDMPFQTPVIVSNLISVLPSAKG